MSGLIDVLSEDGLRTGEILSRAEIHRLGKRHRAVHLYLFNSQNELLLQRRSLTVDHAPGIFSISVTGHIDAGEFSSETVRRELEEELGIDASPLQIDFLFSYYQEVVLHETYIDRQFNDVYVTRADLDPALLHIDFSEVSEVKFVSLETLKEMLADDSSIFTQAYGGACRDLLYFMQATTLSKQ